jgi:hypothetical protein
MYLVFVHAFLVTAYASNSPCTGYFRHKLEH